ncbi:MAG: GTP 3',8-cyclase MoaA [Chloroflexi bacterium]|nr:GTP 3',8-cyclase MoaA [Chloroflexota bacterium]
MSGVSDSFQRPISYLRVSVTDRCNLRCVYCMPAGGVPLVPRADILSYEEIATVVRVAAGMGIAKVRLSGGEPLAREGLVGLVEMVSRIEGIDDVALTTNGVLLREQAAGLAAAGLRRVNVSLDSLKTERFRQITGYDALRDVLDGIEEARRAGLAPIKVNMVVMRGVNDDEVVDFALLSRQGWHIRFIELMPLVEEGRKPTEFVPASEIRQSLSSLGELAPCDAPLGNGPASYFQLPGAGGTVGFITPVSEHFCFKCNRLRLSADGKLLPCLLADDEIDLRQVLRREASPQDEIRKLILKAVAAKPQGHRVEQGVVPRKRTMTQVGG